MDALVKLYQLPPETIDKEKLVEHDITIRHAMAYEKTKVCSWVAKHFTQGWADECGIAFNHSPISCLIAIRDSKLVGFACHEVTSRNFFGPLGVIPDEQKKGVGEALLIKSLYAMRSLGYAYAIIGACDGSESFYIKTVNASIIDESTPGIYPKKLQS